MLGVVHHTVPAGPLGSTSRSDRLTALQPGAKPHARSEVHTPAMAQGSSQPCHAGTSAAWATGFGPATPGRSEHRRRPCSTPQKPWVVADWKHRVPEAAGSRDTRSERGGAVCTAPQTARQVAERARQLETDFAGVHATIDRVLGRCNLLSEQLAGSRAGFTRSHRTSISGGSSRSRHRSTTTSSSGSLCAPSTPDVADATRKRRLHVTMRSRLLFEAPPCQQQQAYSSGDGGSSGGSDSPGRSVAQQQRLVDLNPGFSFRCGQPQREAILLSHVQPATAAATAAAGGLTHRETLQAGIQALTAEFYAAVKQRQHQEWLQRRSCWEEADIIPTSWFGP